MKTPDAPLFSGTGKSFFLKHLFKNLILRESHLVAEDADELRKKQIRQRWAYAGVALVSMVFMALCILGYYRANQEIMETRELFAHAEVINTDLSHPEVSSRLLTLTRGISLHMKFTDESSWRSLGLSPRDTLTHRLDEAQATILLKDILPLLEQDLHARLKGSASEDPASYYHALAVYLLLQRQTPRPAEHLNRHLLAIYEPQLRSDLSDEIIEWSSSVLSNDATVVIEPNADLVQRARQQLWNLPQGVLMQSLLNEAFADAAPYDLKVSEKLGPYAEISMTARDGATPPNWIVPGLFTESGYQKIYAPRRKAYLEQQLSERYVLGQEGPLTLQDAHRKLVELEQTYFNAYAEVWQGLLTNLTLRTISNRTLAITRLESHMGSGDPIRLLFALVSDETDLEEPLSDPKAANAVAQIELQLSPGDNPEMMTIPDTYRKQLKDQFASCNMSHSGVGASKASVDALLSDLREILQTAETKKQANTPTFEALKIKIAALPEPWKSWYGLLVEQSRQIVSAN